MRSAGPVAIDVYDIGGRRVARVAVETMGAGRQSVDWDGRDATGNPAASGLYFLRLRGLVEESRAVRVLVLR
jgi:flagellar hook assembly protein FlgD